MKKVLFLSVMCLVALAINAQTYVDLGLPSGTKWKKTNEQGLFTYEDAMGRFGKQIPTKKQCDELIKKCDWKWTGRGFDVVGPNGESIFMPALGYRDCSGYQEEVGFGQYWTSTPDGEYRTWLLIILSAGAMTANNDQCGEFSVRLVQK